jgi:threonine dehydratase
VDTKLVTLADVEAARKVVGEVVRLTPLEPCRPLAAKVGGPVWLKCENLQRAGSYKVRGAMNRIAGLTPDERARGVVAASAGNHAQGVAVAAGTCHTTATVFMPVGAPLPKVAATKGYGARVELVGATVDESLVAAQQFANETGAVFIHPFDDPDVIAGHATIGTEIMADCADPALILVPVGGGGLISGVAAAVRAAQPDRTTRIVGVEPASANAMTHALRTGAPTPPPTKPSSIADGLAAPFAGDHTLAHVQALVDDVLMVDEAAIRDAWWALMDATKLLLEPSSAVGLAALRAGLIDPPPGVTVVLVLSGGNTSRAGIASLGG